MGEVSVVDRIAAIVASGVLAYSFGMCFVALVFFAYHHWRKRRKLERMIRNTGVVLSVGDTSGIARGSIVKVGGERWVVLEVSGSEITVRKVG